jgi:acetyl-CoA synthetase
MVIPLRGRTPEQLHRLFRWPELPEFNIGAACCDVHPPSRPALIYIDRRSEPRTVTYGQLSRQSGRLASAYRGMGLRPGDRVAVCLPQSPETALAHLGAYKAGLVAVPLSPLFGPEALSYRLADSSARLLVTDADGLERCTNLPGAAGLDAIVVAGETAGWNTRSSRPGGAGRPRILGFDDAIASASSAQRAAATAGDDPCLLIYTSGTTGPPKGVLHAHRVLIGQAPGFRLAHEFAPRPGDRFWTPADWAWVGGLVNSLLLAWFHGLTVIGAWRQGFDPEWAGQLMARQAVRNAFLPTTALRMILEASAVPGVRLRTIVTGGEAQEPDLLDRCIARFGIGFNESYGQTEADFIVGNCSARWAVRPGSAGLGYPGHEVRVMRENGSIIGDAGEIGEIVVKGPDPAFLLRYWKQPEATAAKFTGPWLRTGDLGSMDEASYVWFHARADEVIKSAGYRIGPTEIEECMRRHPAVREVAVVGAPDRLRGQVVHAYVVTAAGARGIPGLDDDLRQYVRARLAAYQYPRRISFVADLPRTATNKVDRAALRQLAASEIPERDPRRARSSIGRP